MVYWYKVSTFSHICFHSFFFSNVYLFIYLFGCIRSQLWQAGSLVAFLSFFNFSFVSNFCHKKVEKLAQRIFIHCLLFFPNVTILSQTLRKWTQTILEEIAEESKATWNAPLALGVRSQPNQPEARLKPSQCFPTCRQLSATMILLPHLCPYVLFFINSAKFLKQNLFEKEFQILP